MHRLIVVSLALVSLVLAWFYMAAISRTDPWYRNTDMNIHNMVDALLINSDVRPNPFDQPAVPLKYLLALDYRVRHYLGLLPVWNLKKFGASADPLREIPALIHIERIHSRVLVILFILSAAWLAYTVTREVEPACFTVILLCGSSGLLFHGLLIRPELLCVGFGNVLALACTWRALTARSWWGNHAWLFLAGLLVGLSTLEKLPGICYFGLCYGWCWLAALTSPPGSAPRRTRPPFWGGLLPAAGGAAALALLFLLGKFHEALGPVVITRLRFAAVLIALLPLLLAGLGRRGLGLFTQHRGRELALLGAGVLSALLVSHLLLRGVMSEASAAGYFSGALHFIVDPAPYMKDLLYAKQESGHAFMMFVDHAPFLFVGATAIAIGAGLVRSIPLQLKAFIALLWVGALGMTYVMSKRHHLAQYDIFPEVPLLLVLTLSLYAFAASWQERHRANAGHWAVPLVFTAGLLLMLTSYFRVRPIYDHYQSDADLPVNSLTLTFLYDHDEHAEAYLTIMKTHYGSRDAFAKTLQQYLADPAHRY